MNWSYAPVVYLLAFRFCTDMRGHGSDWLESCEGVIFQALHLHPGLESQGHRLKGDLVDGVLAQGA